MKSAIVAIQAVLMIIIASTCARLFFLEIPPVATADSMSITGWALSAAGACLILWGILSLRRSFTVFVHPKNQLVTKGAYRISRNPLYLGGLFICFGSALILHSILCTVETLILLVVLNVKIRLEEAELGEKFGPSYEAYRAKTARWLKLFS